MLKKEEIYPVPVYVSSFPPQQTRKAKGYDALGSILFRLRFQQASISIV